MRTGPEPDGPELATLPRGRSALFITSAVLVTGFLVMLAPIMDSIASFGVGFQRARAMKSFTTAASSSPLSSCRKCPAPQMVVCGCPWLPGMASRVSL